MKYCLTLGSIAGVLSAILGTPLSGRINKDPASSLDDTNSRDHLKLVDCADSQENLCTGGNVGLGNDSTHNDEPSEEGTISSEQELELLNVDAQRLQIEDSFSEGSDASAKDRLEGLETLTQDLENYNPKNESVKSSDKYEIANLLKLKQDLKGLDLANKTDNSNMTSDQAETDYEFELAQIKDLTPSIAPSSSESPQSSSKPASTSDPDYVKYAINVCHSGGTTNDNWQSPHIHPELRNSTKSSVGDFFIEWARGYGGNETFKDRIPWPENSSVPDTLSTFASGIQNFRCDPPLGDCTLPVDVNCHNEADIYFVLYAIANFGNFLSELKQSFNDVNEVMSDISGRMVETFTTSNASPGSFSQSITDASLIISVLGMIIPELAVVLEPLAIFMGLLEGVSPKESAEDREIKNWEEFSSFLGEFQEKLQNAIENYSKRMLQDQPVNNATYVYAEDPTGLPQILKNGAFATQPHVSSYPPSLIAISASAGINALWSQEQIFIVKISSITYGSSICDPPLFGSNDWCDENKTDHMILKWMGVERRRQNIVQFDMTPQLVVSKSVPGIGSLSDPAFGKITVKDVVQSSMAVQQAHGIGGQSTADELAIRIEQSAQTGGLAQSISSRGDKVDGAESTSFLSFNLPLCDLDTVLAQVGIQNACVNGNKPIMKTLPEWQYCLLWLAGTYCTEIPNWPWK